MNKTIQEIEEYVQRRDKAIISLDEEACKNLFIESGAGVPQDKLVFGLLFIK